MAFLSVFALNFYSSVCKRTTFCCKKYSPCKIWKKPIDNTCLFSFFTTFCQIWPKVCLKTTPTLIFLLVSNEICLGIQLILITLIGISSNINKVIRVVLNSLFSFLQKKFTRPKKSTKRHKKPKNHKTLNKWLSLRCFLYAKKAYTSKKSSP